MIIISYFQFRKKNTYTTIFEIILLSWRGKKKPFPTFPAAVRVSNLTNPNFHQKWSYLSTNSAIYISSNAIPKVTNTWLRQSLYILVHRVSYKAMINLYCVPNLFSNRNFKDSKTQTCFSLLQETLNKLSIYLWSITCLQ